MTQKTKGKKFSCQACSDTGLLETTDKNYYIPRLGGCFIACECRDAKRKTEESEIDMLRERETKLKKILFPIWSGDPPPPEDGCLCAECGAEVDIRGDDDEHERWDNAKDMCDQCKAEKFDRARELFPLEAVDGGTEAS